LVRKTVDNLQYLFHRGALALYQPAERINVTTTGEDSLRDLFLSSLSADEAINNLSNLSSVLANLGYFFENLHERRAQLELEVGERVILQLLRLYSTDARNQYVSWKQLRDLLESRTLLTFPIERVTRVEYADYSERLRAQGIVDAPAPTGVQWHQTQQMHQAQQQMYRPAGTGAGSSSAHPHSHMATLLQHEHDRLRSSSAHTSHTQPQPHLSYDQPLPAPTLAPTPTLMDVETDHAALKTALLAMRFLDLSPADQAAVDDVVYGPNNDEVLIDKFWTPMSRTKVICLRPRTWLNDEVRWAAHERLMS
jgi:hypothetical protein